MSTIERTRETLPAGTWQVDSVHSHVGFAIEYLVGTFRGSFSPVEASLEVADEGNAILTGAVRAENVKVQDENLTAHLLTPEFFDAERAPEIRFASQELRRDGDLVHGAGELTIKGITQPVEFRGTISDPIDHPMGGQRLGLKLAATIDRRNFGLDWNLPLPSGEPALANDVAIEAELYFAQA